MFRVETAEIDTVKEMLTAEDQEYIATMRSERRRKELIAWRSLLRNTLLTMGLEGESRQPILYSEMGAPYLAGSEIFFSVTHSQTHIAIVVSDHRCAIDIESIDRNFERAADRYASLKERKLLIESNIPKELHLPLIWCAKETLYKFSATNNLDLLNDLKIISVNKSNVIGNIRETSTTIEWRVENNQLISYIAR